VKLILNPAETAALTQLLRHQPSNGCEIEILSGEGVNRDKVGLQVRIGTVMAVIALQAPAKDDK
jgi:hypothetical protein